MYECQDSFPYERNRQINESFSVTHRYLSSRSSFQGEIDVVFILLEDPAWLWGQLTGFLIHAMPVSISILSKLVSPYRHVSSHRCFHLELRSIRIDRHRWFCQSLSWCSTLRWVRCCDQNCRTFDRSMWKTTSLSLQMDKQELKLKNAQSRVNEEVQIHYRLRNPAIVQVSCSATGGLITVMFALVLVIGSLRR